MALPVPSNLVQVYASKQMYSSDSWKEKYGEKPTVHRVTGGVLVTQYSKNMKPYTRGVIIDWLSDGYLRGFLHLRWFCLHRNILPPPPGKEKTI